MSSWVTQDRNVGDYHYNGRTFEELMLGSDREDIRHVPCFYQALYDSILSQPEGFPDNPKTGIGIFLNYLRKFFPTSEFFKVKVFSTVKKPLDYHGVDCFFYHRGTIVTVDLTIKDRKINPRADFVLTDRLAAGNDKEIEDFTEQIATLLISDHKKLPLKLALLINNMYPVGYHI